MWLRVQGSVSQAAGRAGQPGAGGAPPFLLLPSTSGAAGLPATAAARGRGKSSGASLAAQQPRPAPHTGRVLGAPGPT